MFPLQRSVLECGSLASAFTTGSRSQALVDLAQHVSDHVTVNIGEPPFKAIVILC